MNNKAKVSMLIKDEEQGGSVLNNFSDLDDDENNSIEI